MKKRRFIVLLLTVAMTLSIAACGSGESTTESSDTETAETETEESETESETTDSAGDSSVYIGAAFTSLGTQSFNDDTLSGIVNAAEEMGVPYDYVELSEVSDAANVYRTLIGQGCNFIVVSSMDYYDAAAEVAAEYPDVKFYCIDGSIEGYDNVAGVEFRENEASFLAGALAAMLTETNKIGTVLAKESVVQLRYEYGYLAGAAYVNPDCEVTVMWTNSFADTNLGMEMASTLYSQGADYVSTYAGACNLGVFNAASEAGDGCYCLGGGTGQFDQNPDKIVASVVKPVDVALYNVICDYVTNGTFEGNTTEVWGLAESGVELRFTTENDELLASIPDEVMETIEELEEQILAGETEVPATEEEYEAFISALN